MSRPPHRSFGDEHARPETDDQSRNLTDDSVADRERGIKRGRVADIQPVAQSADHDATDRVDERNDDRGDRIATYELGGAAHRAEERALLFKFFATGARLLVG